MVEGQRMTGLGQIQLSTGLTATGRFVIEADVRRGRPHRPLWVKSCRMTTPRRKVPFAGLRQLTVLGRLTGRRLAAVKPYRQTQKKSRYKSRYKS